MHCTPGPRNPRDGAPVITMDLSRPTEVIHADLRQRFPHVTGLWWELEEDERSGWAYDGTNSVRAKMVHVV